MSLARCIAVLAMTLAASPAWAADASAGATRFATPPQAGLLACIDCHSDNPQLNNFGNIWSGRNAVALIQRAVNANTGGMGYFNQFYSAADFANIAAFLGNAPASLRFESTALSSTSAAQTVTVSSSTKTGFDALALTVEGDFVIVANGCGSSVARFTSCTVDVAFRPRGEGTRSGVLLLAHDGTPTPVRVALSGEGARRPKAVATLVPTALNFGAVPLGGEGAMRLVVLANNSVETLTLGSITSSPNFVLTGGSCVSGAALRSGQRCVLALRMAPAALGPTSGLLTVVHDGIDGRSEVALTGSGAPAQALLRSDTESVDFGSVAPGAAAPARVISLVNHGSSALTLRESGVSDAAFKVDASSCVANAALAPQARCQVTLSFQPGREAVFSGEWRATSSDGAVLRVPLVGRGTTIAAAAVPMRLVVSEGLGQTRRSEIALVNHGSVAWQLRSLLLTGPEATDFAVNGGSCQIGMSLPAGASCTVAISFTPRAVGARLARLQATHDGSAGPLNTALVTTLLGQGHATPQAELWLDAAALDFGALLTGSGLSTLTLNASNRGRAALSWQHIALVGEHAGDFTLGGDCRVTSALAAAAGCGISLRFAPRAAGHRSATLVLWPEGAAAPAMVSLQGRGSTAAVPSDTVSAAPGTTSFAAAALGETRLSEALSLSNATAVSSSPLRLVFSGDAAQDFSLDPGSTCATGLVLAPAASCTLRLRFHPTQAGLRRAVLSTAGGVTPSTFALQGQALAPALPDLRATPALLAFAARTGQAAPAQPLWLRNVGAAALRVDALTLLGSGYAFGATGSMGACAADGFELLPGSACALDVAWSGSAAAAAGATLSATGPGLLAQAAVPLSVTEDPAQQSNIGTGGGNMSALSLLALCIALLALSRTKSRHD